MTLPEWNAPMSDGCSACPLGPRPVRKRLNVWLFSAHPGATEGCERHDRAYYGGGTKADRLAADERLMFDWAGVGVPRPVRVLAYRLIRVFGRPGSKMPGVSWAYGGGFFKYADDGWT